MAFGYNTLEMKLRGNFVDMLKTILDKDFKISSYRTEHGAEVDFILELEGKVYAIEVKASKNIGKSDLRGFQSFKEFYKKPHKSYVAYLGNYEEKIDEVTIFPWVELIKELGL